MSATTLWPGRGLALLGGFGGRRARHALSGSVRWAVLSALDAGLSASDAALTSPLAREAVGRILASPLADDLFQRLVSQVLESPDLQRLVAQTLDSPDLRRLVAQTLDSPVLERLIAQSLGSPEAERLAGRVIDSRLVDVVVQRLLASDGLWILVDEIAQSPSVTAAITQQGVGFASQIAGVARDRSRTADDRLERLAARLTRHLPRAAAGPSDQPAS